jgi:hypothetical protein
MGRANYFITVLIIGINIIVKSSSGPSLLRGAPLLPELGPVGTRNKRPAGNLFKVGAIK